MEPWSYRIGSLQVARAPFPERVRSGIWQGVRQGNGALSDHLVEEVLEGRSKRSQHA